MAKNKVTAPDLAALKQKGRKIVTITAYDALYARLVEKAGVDVVLVGDSLGQVFQGLPSTIGVKLEHVIYHCRAVSRGISRPLLVGDMPWMSFQVSIEETIGNAGRMLSEGRCEAVKLEGGAPMIETVRRLTQVGIPVMAHIGLTPQSVNAFGGYNVQGRDAQQAEQLKRDAQALEQAGAFSLVLEAVPATLAAEISQMLAIPTIGIGAGAGCDGQVLVITDLLGVDERFNPKFLKKYANLSETVVDAVKSYAEEVREGKFPEDKHSY